MRKTLIAAVAAVGLLAGCTTQQGALVGGAAGAAVVGLAGGSLAQAIIGAGVGALAGAVLVQHTGNTCYYKYKGKYYKEPCP
jgi:osmotically inducible lipoprotein OsmB